MFTWYDEETVPNTCVTAGGWRAGNTRLNFVRPGSNPVGERAGLLRQPSLLL